MTKQPELRQITAVFADLVGSTKLSTTLDIEDYHATLAEFHRCCTDIVRCHNGVPARFIGDAILACFGFPAAAENDAVRAVLAAQKIIIEIPKLHNATSQPLSARVGIATGVVMTGELLHEGNASFGPASGATLNLAARLQALAEPNSIYIDQNTRGLIPDYPSMNSIGEQKLEGFAEGQVLWRLDPKEDEPQAVSIEQSSVDTSIIGREEELRLFSSLWNSIERKGAFVHVSGEPGIGKSRLMNELGISLLLKPEQIYAMECRHTASLRPLHPITSLIWTLSGIGTLTEGKNRLFALRRWVEGHLKLSPVTADLVYEMIEPGDIDTISAGSQQPNMSRIFEALVLFIERLGISSPILMIVEDIHWGDPTTLEFLEYLAEQVASIKAMVVCTSRTDPKQAIGSTTSAQNIELRRLDSQQSQQLITELANDHDLPTDSIKLIAERSDGIPLFVEEFTKTAMEHQDNALQTGSVEVLKGLPTTLHGLLLAKLDRVKDVAEVAPVGAAIGRIFSRELLLQAIDIPESAADAILSQLIDMELLRLSGTTPTLRYEFKHTLVRDAAYSTMPKSRRSAVHLRIGTLMEQRLAAGGVLPEALAYHFDLGNSPEKACKYWREAADQAHKSWAGKEAVAHIQAALRANDRAEPGRDQIDREAQLRESLRSPLILSGLGASHTLSNLERLRDLRAQQGDDAELLSVLHGLSSYHLMVGRLKDARQIAAEIMGRYRVEPTEGYVVPHILARRVLGFCCFLSGDFDDALEEFGQVIQLCETADAQKIEKFYHSDTVLIAQCMSVWARSLNGGQRGLSAHLVELGAAADLEDGWCKAYAHSLIAAVYQALGDADACLRHATKAMDLSEDHGFKYWIAWCRILRGWAIARKGRADEGCAYIEEGIGEYTATGSLQFVPQARALLAEGLIRSGRIAEASQVLNELAGHRRPAEIGYVDALVGSLFDSQI